MIKAQHVIGLAALLIILVKRMYLDMMEQVLSGMNKVIISPNLNKSMVPYLPLNNLAKN